jgi:predicted small metal-binding protein
MHAQSSPAFKPNCRKLTFRCCDLKIKDCNWQTEGNTEDEVLGRVAVHFREKHGFALDLATQTIVRQAICGQTASANPEGEVPRSG